MTDNNQLSNEEEDKKIELLNMKDDIFVKENTNDESKNQDQGVIHNYIVHPPLKLGKKIYFSEYIAEFFIKSIAFLSIAFILAIFYYVFQEATFAFKDEKHQTTQELQKASDKGNSPDTYGETSNTPETYGETSNTPETYGETSNTPETYGETNNTPETYGETNNTPETYGETSNTPDSYGEPTVQLPIKSSNEEPIKSVESNSGKAITVKKLILPNDKIDGKNEFIWQPISEIPKFSLIPLALGALKVTLVGILIAAPLGILAALFTTAFAPRWLKELMKPVIEILAGFPSVVIGFFCLITLSTLIQTIFHTTYRLNSFVGGIGMALAVIPIIYTVTEDALSAVPKYMKEASLALGASRWQTAYKVTLPAAVPGVFAAVILGFGRAFGETMIALMATGNAALTSANLFESVRTLAATIGAEMAEVDFHSVHYGILFLIGALLFVVTFTLNAIAEFYVRNKLLKKFQGQ